MTGCPPPREKQASGTIEYSSPTGKVAEVLWGAQSVSDSVADDRSEIGHDPDAVSVGVV
jgi:hypothetical protein